MNEKTMPRDRIPKRSGPGRTDNTHHSPGRLELRRVPEGPSPSSVPSSPNPVPDSSQTRHPGPGLALRIRQDEARIELSRRRFLGTLGALGIAAWKTHETLEGQDEELELHSVTGSLSLSQAGVILPHEHVMSLFGADLTEIAQYDQDALLAAVIPYLRKLKSLGCGTLADCTTAYFGRSPALLKRISEASGLNILTNTGYYAAANDRYVPRHAYQESAERLAGRWIDEWKHGIGETGIRPGFLKTGVDEGSLSDIDAKMIRAAAMTHRETGLTIASHTGDNPGSAAEQLEILEAHGVAATAWIWVHAHTVGEPAQLLPAAERGAWIELDGVSPENSEKHLRLVEFLKSRGYADQILLSHDGNSFRYGGRPSKAYDGLFTTFIPMLKSRDYSTEEINRLLAGNPFRALAPRVRRR